MSNADIVKKAYTYFFSLLTNDACVEHTTQDIHSINGFSFLEGYVQPLKLDTIAWNIFDNRTQDYFSALSRDFDNEVIYREKMLKKKDIAPHLLHETAYDQICNVYEKNNIDLVRVRVGTYNDRLICTVNTNAPNFLGRDTTFLRTKPFQEHDEDIAFFEFCDILDARVQKPVTYASDFACNTFAPA